MSVTRRQRPLPASMFTEEPLLELESDVRLTGIGLRFYVDDHGRGSARLALIKASLWPIHEEVTEDALELHLLQLEEVGYIQLYEGPDERSYLRIVEWPKVDRPDDSYLPEPPPLASRSRAARESLAVVGGEERGGGGAVGKAGRDGEGEAPAREGPAALTLLRAEDEPSPFCSRHPTGTEAKCGGCATARKRHDLWLRAQEEAG
jgi:hypothetical protein